MKVMEWLKLQDGGADKNKASFQLLICQSITDLHIEQEEVWNLFRLNNSFSSRLSYLKVYCFCNILKCRCVTLKFYNCLQDVSRFQQCFHMPRQQLRVLDVRQFYANPQEERRNLRMVCCLKYVINDFRKYTSIAVVKEDCSKSISI